MVTRLGDGDFPASLRASKIPLRVGLLAAAAIVGLLLLDSCYFTVQQNSASSVTRMGALVRGPLSPGPHFKLPLVEHAYSIETSINRVIIPDVVTQTIDGQFVHLLGMQITYHVPLERVNQALFKVGGMGNNDIMENAIPVISDHAGRVFGKINTLDVNSKKDQLAEAIKLASAPEVLQNFGIAIDSVQLPKIDYDERYKNFLAETNNSKLKIVQAQANTVTAENEAKRREAEAKGVAESQIEAARGASESQKLAALGQASATEADARAKALATTLQADADAHRVAVSAEAQAKADTEIGSAQSSVLASMVSAAGGPDAYARQLQAKALGNWNGTVPQMVLGGDKGGPQTFMPIPLPGGPAHS